VLRYPRLIWLHLPALAWGVIVQWADWICPLTPMEDYLRRLGGEAGYGGGFIEHFIGALLYPANLTLELRYLLGLSLLMVNLAIYAYVIVRSRAGPRA
jgi:hypothetical protein